jgi:hypothetical protein
LVHKSAFFPKKVKPTPIFSPKSRVTENPQYEKTQIYTQKGVLFTITHKETQIHTQKGALFTKIYIFLAILSAEFCLCLSKPPRRLSGVSKAPAALERRKVVLLYFEHRLVLCNAAVGQNNRSKSKTHNNTHLLATAD